MRNVAANNNKTQDQIRGKAENILVEQSIELEFGRSSPELFTTVVNKVCVAMAVFHQ